MIEYACPNVLRPTRLSFYLQHNTLHFTAPITRVTQMMRREGANWMAEAAFDPLNRVHASVLGGLLAALAASAQPGDVLTGPY